MSNKLQTLNEVLWQGSPAWRLRKTRRRIPLPQINTATSNKTTLNKKNNKTNKNKLPKSNEEVEKERIEQLYQRIDPIVKENITRRYNKIFQSLQNKKTSRNQGRWQHVNAGNFSELMHIQQSPYFSNPINNAAYKERFKLLSKPYYNNALKQIENLRRYKWNASKARWWDLYQGKWNNYSKPPPGKNKIPSFTRGV